MKPIQIELDDAIEQGIKLVQEITEILNEKPDKEHIDLRCLKNSSISMVSNLAMAREILRKETGEPDR